MIKNLLIALIIAMLGFTGWYVYHSRSVANRLLDDSANLTRSVKLAPKNLSQTTATAASQASYNSGTPVPAALQTQALPAHNSCLPRHPKPGQMSPFICVGIDQ